MTQKIQNFQAETKELLKLMIHSLYSNPEIFLRELISNASDAIEKLRFQKLTQSHLMTASPSQENFEILIQADPQKRTLSITDNGIGMTEDEVIENIGNIAHSGTKAFLKRNSETLKNPDLVGQFGVGFYSAFMVAQRVTLHTKKIGAFSGTFWSSDGLDGTYLVEERPRPEGHGTTITLELKPIQKDEETQTQDLQDFSNPSILKSIIQKYSNFVSFPIRFKAAQSPILTEKTEELTTKEETWNTQKALWLRSPSEVDLKEYQEFYKSISYDWLDPLKHIHYRAEGALEFTALLFIPAKKSLDYEYKDHKIGLNLYVKRIFIKDHCEELLPHYLRFVQGIVDSNDLSLNVSREILQQDQQMLRIKKALTLKILNSLQDFMQNDFPTYEQFWKQFGTTLKEGLAGEETAYQEKLKDLTLFHSTHADTYTSLKSYVSRMPAHQTMIYYLVGEQLTQLKESPYLEKLKKKGIEVLFMHDPIDAWMTSHLQDYAGKTFQSVMDDHLDLNALSSTEDQQQEKQHLETIQLKLKPLLTSIQNALKDQIQEVKFSDRLTESPVCLVSAGNHSPRLERVLHAMGQDIPKAKRILEINPHHPLYEKMLSLPLQEQENWSDILYQQALLNEGSPIENPLKYAQKIAELMINTKS